MKKQAGVTLLELLVAVSVFIVLVTLAVPAMDEYVARNRQVAQLNSLIAALHTARSEAVKRAKPVTVCAANAALDGCSGDNEWEKGWLVFVDTGTAGTIDGTDVIVRSREPLSADNTLRATGFSNLTRVTYFAAGTLSPSASSAAESGMFTLCMAAPRNDARLARGVTINAVGLIEQAKDANDDGVINALDGTTEATCS